MMKGIPAVILAGLFMIIMASAAEGVSIPFLQEQEQEDEKNPRQEKLQLEPGRKLQGTFTEGSWMSVDVSPDGQTLVFDFLGDLYTLPISGGRAERLTEGIGFDAQPRFSPDGSRVVFTSDRDGGENVWIISLDRSDTTQVTRGKNNSYQSPEWAPGGDYVVATRQGKLWMYHVDGGSGIQLISEPAALRTTGAAFGDDERYIWYAQRSGGWTYNSAMNDYQVAVYDRETGESSVEIRRYGGAFRPTLSPDGQWVVYGTRHIAETALRVRNIETGEERWLAHPVQRDDQESVASRDAYPGMAFTPDSRELVATYGGKLWRIPVQGSDPIQIPFEVQADVDLGPEVDFDYPIQDTETFTAKQIRDAVPSPDGSRVAFVVLGDTYVMDYPDGEPEKVADLEEMEYQPVWSSDGEWLAFGAVSASNEGHLYRVRSSGGQAEQLTDRSALYRDPVWSPDGSRVVALRTSGREYEEALERGTPSGDELIWVPADGGSTSVISRTGGVSAPHFVSGSDRIYAFGGGQGLVSMRWDGTDRKQHLRVQQASLIRMAPEGDQALAQIVNDIYVVAVPLLGGEIPNFNVRSNPDNAPVPAKKLTDIGGQFPAWSSDGRTVHWSVGNAYVAYDLDAAKVYEDSVSAVRDAEDEAEEEEEEEEAEQEEGEGEEEEDDEGYQPAEIRIEIEVTRDTPRGTIALRGARIVTMIGDEVIERGDVVIEDNRIVALGPSGSVDIPAGAREIDVSGRTIVPGYIDTHAHLRASASVHRAQPWSYAANLAFGVTTTRDPQTGTTDVLTYEDMVRAGRTLGPRIYSTGPGVFSSENIRDLDHAKEVLSRYSDYYDTKTIKMYGAGNREQRQWIIDAARQLELMPTTEGGLDLKENLTMALDGYSGTEHNLPGFPLYDDVVQLVASSKMATTPTILVTYGGPWAENYYYATEDVLGDKKLRWFTPFEEIHRKALRRPGPGPGPSGWFHPEVHTFKLISSFINDVVQAGGRAGVGSHGQLQGLGFHWELWSVGSSMDPHDALKVATILGAESLGLDTDLGTIEMGKLADLVILSENPLENLRYSTSIDMVMMNGRLYDGDTLDEVWPNVRSVGPFYWHDGAQPDTPAGIR